ncbi:MAG: Uma2 family endonuclease [Chloroflexi bacterium]|nr:Uma2 family endonuclease [Chloroflexota bacterium]
MGQHVPAVTADQALQQLLRSPRLPEAVRRLQAVARAEAKKRRYFYDVVTEQQKAEFINGEIIVHSPVKLRHSLASENLFTLMMMYVRKHSLGVVFHEKILIVLTRNDYEPDICFFGPEKARAFTPDQSKFPAPELAVEVLSESTAVVDRGIKFEDYATHGVGEYWIVDPVAETIEQYVLHEGVYQLVVKVKTGSIVSTIVTGFEIPVRAVFDGPAQFAALQAILAG